MTLLITLSPAATWLSRNAPPLVPALGNHEHEHLAPLIVLMMCELAWSVVVLASFLLAGASLWQWLAARTRLQRAKIDWWAIASLAWVPLAATAIGVFVAAVKLWTYWAGAPLPEPLFRTLAFALIDLCLTAFFLVPVVVPVLHVQAGRIFDLGSYAYCLVALLALPFAATMSSAFQVIGDAVINNGGFRMADFFSLELPSTRCTSAILHGLGIPQYASLNDNSAAGFSTFLFFWIDTDLKTILLDLPDSFGCSLTQLRANPRRVAAGHLGVHLQAVCGAGCGGAQYRCRSGSACTSARDAGPRKASSRVRASWLQARASAPSSSAHAAEQERGIHAPAFALGCLGFAGGVAAGRSSRVPRCAASLSPRREDGPRRCSTRGPLRCNCPARSGLSRSGWSPCCSLRPQGRACTRAATRRERRPFSYRRPAVADDGLAGGERSRLGGQEHGGARDLVGLADAGAAARPASSA